MEVSGQLNAAAALSLVKELIVLTGEEPLVAAHGLSERRFLASRIELPILRTSGPFHGSPSSNRRGKVSIPDQSM